MELKYALFYAETTLALSNVSSTSVTEGRNSFF